MKNIVFDNNQIFFESLNFYWRVAPNKEPFPGIPQNSPLKLGFNNDLSLIEQIQVLR